MTSLFFTPYCITCQKNLLHENGHELDGIPNGQWTQAMATSHARKYPGHKVINGTTFVANREEVHKGYTRDELKAAFEKVQDLDHWKNPIFTRIPIKDVDVTRAAIEFYVGDSPTVSRHPSGQDAYVESDGYYKIVGA